MYELGRSWEFLFRHPLVGVAVFVGVTLGVVMLLSGGRLGASLAGMLRVAISFFTAPFLFLRDALIGMSESGAEEEQYRGSRIFLMFRWSKLLYLALLLWCLLGLSGGVTTSLVSLWPSYEIEQGELLDGQIAELERQVASANESVVAAGAPDYRAQLQTQRDQARTTWQQQAQSNADFVQSSSFTGPIISQLAGTRSAYTVENIRSNIDNYMSSCPRGYNWRGMTIDSCEQYRAFVTELANRRLNEFQAENAAQQAERAFRDVSSAAAAASANLAALEAQLQSTRQARAQISLFNPEVIKERATTAAAGLLATLLSVIVVVWLLATLISFYSWAVLMMRGLELMVAKYLGEARPRDDLAA